MLPESKISSCNVMKLAFLSGELSDIDIICNSMALQVFICVIFGTSSSCDFINRESVFEVLVLLKDVFVLHGLASLAVGEVSSHGKELEGGVKNYKCTQTNTKCKQLFFIESLEHRESGLSIAMCLVHILGHFEVVESHGVVGEVGGELDVDNEAISISAPFRMVIEIFGEKTDLLNECRSLLE